IVDLLIGAAALLHLPIDRPEMLRPAVHLARYALDPQLILEWMTQCLDVLFTLRPLVRDLLGERAILVRLQVLEGQVLELPADLGHTEAVRERCVDLTRLRRDATSLVRTQ